MRILCISPFFPPIRDSEAFCGGKMLLALIDQGADVTVLSMTAAYLEGKQDLSGVWQRLRPCAIPIGPGAGRQRLRAALCCLRYRISIWPRWIDQVIRTASQLHDAEPFDVVYSRSLPMFGHVAGYWAAKKLGLRWVANVNDPWDEHLFPGIAQVAVSPVYRRISEFWLKRTLASADAVTFPSARLARFTARLAGSDRNGKVMPHVGWRSETESGPGTEFRLVHAGKLGSNEITGRSTRALLVGLRRFLDRQPPAREVARLVLVGPEDEKGAALIGELGLENHVTHAGPVSYEESLRHIASASVCVLVEAEMPEGVYLPSKLADYLVAGKPVLALSPKAGTVSDLAVEQGILRVDARDGEQIEDALHRLYRSFLENRLADAAPSKCLVAHFRGDRIARDLLALIADLNGERKLEQADLGGGAPVMQRGSGELAGERRAARATL